MAHDDVSPWLARGLYLFGIAFMLTAAIDLFTTVWPLRPTQIAWRYGFLGLSGGYLQTPALGFALIIVTAIWQERPGILRVAGVACLLTALILIGVMGIFALDVLQVRQLRAEEMQSTVLAGGIFQEVKFFVAAFIFAFFGYGAMKTAKAMASDASLNVRRSPTIVSAPSRAGSVPSSPSGAKAPPAPPTDTAR
jgi:hypothetical protein